MVNLMSTPNRLEHKAANETCEAFGCRDRATKEVKVNAGKFGVFTLFVCASCTGKFQDA